MNKLYLGRCALTRPYDLPVLDRMLLEALAVATLLKAWEEGRTMVLSSTALEVENEHNPDPSRQATVSDILQRFAADGGQVAYGSAVMDRANELAHLGFRFLDALHVSSAEQGACNLLVTCDDGLMRAASGAAAPLRVQVVGPAEALRLIDAEEPP